MLEVLSETWAVALVAPRAPGSECPPGITWYEWIPTRSGESRGFYPWRFDTAPLRAAIKYACRDFSPTVGLAFFGAEDCWPLDGPPAVHDRVDSSALTAWRYVRVAQGIRRRVSGLLDMVEFARYEARVLRSFPAVTVVGDDDARWLRRIGGSCSVHVVPNGVAPAAAGPSLRSPDPLVVFSGNMSYQPNVDAAVHFARSIWPAVRRAIPNARYLIAGRDPSAAVTALDGKDGIWVSGPVRDMAEALAQAWVAVAPMRCGAGVKNKILEAWAAGLPVVLSPIACNGLPMPAGTGDLVHSDDASFGASVVALLQDHARREQLGREASAHVREHCTWRDMAARLDTLLEGVALTHAIAAHRAPGAAARGALVPRKRPSLA
jgi:glycosyltransferase involved in cell wall biosynthesis